MMDYLEVVLPGACSWSRRFEEIRGDIRSLDPQIEFRKSKDYSAVIDMRSVMNIDAMVSFQSRFRGDHKVTVLDVGEKGFEETLGIIAQITDDHPLPLECRRVDLCANTPGVPVSWYAKTIRAQWKQWEVKMGTVEASDGEGRAVPWSEMGKRQLQTIYLGRRPNCFRIYDKTAEQYVRYQAARRAHLRLVKQTYLNELVASSRDSTPAGYEWLQTAPELPAEVMARLMAEFPFPDFETWWGMPRSTVLTRVEREMAGGRVPAKLDRIYKLKQELKDFNPFVRLKGFDSGASCSVATEDYSPVEWLAGDRMVELLRSGEWSRQQLYNFLNRDWNGARTENKFRPFLEAATRNGNSVTAQQLYESYRETVTRQLAA
jgi:hypothetical protein